MESMNCALWSLRTLMKGATISDHRDEHIKAVGLRLEASRARLSRLIDVYTDGMIEKSLFSDKKLSLLMEQKALEEEQHEIARNSSYVCQRLDAILEQLKGVPQAYESGNPHEQRFLLKELTSNVWFDRKNVDIALRSPFQEIRNALPVSFGGPLSDNSRMQSIAKALVQYCDPSFVITNGNNSAFELS
jgi:hypothetical protein